VTPVRPFPDPDALGDALAAEVMAGLAAAVRDGRQYLLGCPSGRTGRSTYAALARRARGADLSGLVVVLMDEYLEPAPGGGFRHVPADAHFACRWFAREVIVGPLDAVAAHPLQPDAVWTPDPADPAAYERRITAAGGIDLFLVASGVSDGHVAFLPPGSALDGGPSVIPLAETTRRDNLATFPAFRDLAEVPTHGVSVGLGTIRRCSRRVVLVLTGETKRPSAARVLAAGAHDPGWPATFIHDCPDPAIWLDAAADPRPQRP
jgi:glucosamine-6-phosphate deaminase